MYGQYVHFNYLTIYLFIREAVELKKLARIKVFVSFYFKGKVKEPTKR